MNEIVNSSLQLPDKLPDLARFVLIGRDKLKAVKAEIHAIDKVGIARDVYKQKLEEAQQIAEVVTDAECRMGELLKAVPKATKGTGSNQYERKAEISPQVDFSKPKSQVIKESGLTQRQAEHFQLMASYPESVEKAKAKAREQETVLSRNDVLREIKEAKKPHVSNNSKDDEWYTPEKYIEAAREVMGTIDLDPASNEFANETVKATTFYDEESNGLEQKWFGNIWLNPPYSTSLIQAFAEKLNNSEFEQGVVLVNNATETQWFKALIEKASAIVFSTGRIKYNKRDGEHGAPLQGQAFIYYGDNIEKFSSVFGKFGWVAIPHD